MTYLNVLDEVSSAVGHFFGCLDKVLLCHRVRGLATSLLTSIAQNTGVFSNHCGSSQHLRGGGSVRGVSVRGG